MYPYIHVFGRVIGTYGVCMAIAVLLAGFCACRSMKKYGGHWEDILIVGGIVVGMALLCGHLLYVFVTYPIGQIIDMIRAGDFSFFGGGIVFYGGLIGGILGALLGCRVAKCTFSSLERAVVPFIPLGHAIGRVGCFMAGCCYGAPYEGPLAVHYPHAVTGLSPEQGYFPVQLLEAALNLVIFCVLLLVRRKKRRPLRLLGAYIGMYGVVRFVLEFFRGDEIRGIAAGLSTSQWIAVGMVAASCLFLCIKPKKK